MYTYTRIHAYTYIYIHIHTHTHTLQRVFVALERPLFTMIYVQHPPPDTHHSPGFKALSTLYRVLFTLERPLCTTIHLRHPPPDTHHSPGFKALSTLQRERIYMYTYICNAVFRHGLLQKRACRSESCNEYRTLIDMPFSAKGLSSDDCPFILYQCWLCIHHVREYSSDCIHDVKEYSPDCIHQTV